MNPVSLLAFHFRLVSCSLLGLEDLGNVKLGTTRPWPLHYNSKEGLSVDRYGAWNKIIHSWDDTHQNTKFTVYVANHGWTECTLFGLCHAMLCYMPSIGIHVRKVHMLLVGCTRGATDLELEQNIVPELKASKLKPSLAIVMTTCCSAPWKTMTCEQTNVNLSCDHVNVNWFDT